MIWSSALNNYDAEMFCSSDQSDHRTVMIFSILAFKVLYTAISVCMAENKHTNVWLHGKKIFRLIQQH